MDCCFQFLYIFDIFKSPVVLLFNSTKKVPSTFSLIVSLAIIIFLTIFFLESDLFYHTTPITSSQTLSTKSRPEMQFSYDNMAFAFIVSDADNKYYYDPSIYTFSMQYQYYNNTVGDLIYEETKAMRFCDRNDFKAHGNYFDELEMDAVICPETGNFSLQGFWDEPLVKTVNVYVYTCNNDTSTVVCKSPSEISKFFKNKYLNAYYSSNIIDVNDYQNPIRLIYQSEFMSLDADFSKIMRLSFKKVSVESDYGVIFPSKQQSTSFIFQGKETDFVPNNEDWIANINLYSANEVYVVSRRYQKFQEAIANVGGLANSLIFIGFALTALEKEFIVFTILMHKLYNFVDPMRRIKTGVGRYLSRIDHKEEEKDGEERYAQKEETPKASTNNNFGGLGQKNSHTQITLPSLVLPKSLPPDEFVLEHYSSNGEILKAPHASLKPDPKKSYRNKIKSLFLVNSDIDMLGGGLKLTFWEFLKIKFRLPHRNLSYKEKLFSKAFEQYPQEIDLIKIIQKIQEIDKLKALILNPQQVQLLDMLVRPSFSCQNEKVLMEGVSIADFAGGEMKGGREKDTVLDLQKYYKSIIDAGENASELDKKLIKLIDEKVV